jgi:hypothetical protein
VRFENQGRVNGAQKNKQTKVRDALPKWGIDFLWIDILVWGPTSRNDGGMLMEFKHLPGSSIRLNPNLILWTWSHFQKWRKTYFGQPLWGCELAYDSDDDGGVYRLVYDYDF